MSDSLLLVVPVVLVYALTAGRRFGQLSVLSLFIYAQATMALGTLPVLDPGSPADSTHAATILLSLVALVGVGIVYSFVALAKPRRLYSPVIDFQYPKRSVTVLIIIAIMISTVYYVSVGYLAVFESLRAIAADSGQDVASLRLESYSGSRYLLPGYVNQFKNALLPALTIVVLASAYHYRIGARHLLSLVLVPLTLVFLLGTGQRGAFVLALGLVVIMAYFTVPKRVHRFIVPMVIVGLLLFFVTTVASGRVVAELDAAEGIGGKLGVLFDQVAFRVLDSNQTTSVVGFRFIYERQIPLGSEWAKSFVGLLPGQEGSDISNQIYRVFFGMMRGTAPLSLWGSAYYNLGLIGVVVFAIVLGIILARLSELSISATRTNLIKVAGVAGVTVSIAAWIADGPITVLNTGLVVYAALWLWGNAIERHGSLEALAPPLSMDVRFQSSAYRPHRDI